ncbi:PBP1A family penicillin-binding protein [Patescibacteria group bacterium]|nr:PBP1A family penicillin-binding protein [Patescibacteria group bacterium]MBU0879667.1 PBP1A family penicillin-binding protein [Patescibacteria group bacterium]MBU0880197.1 PBP1A family penicillin-binding protein [Patescibacteria group bacterium]MBU1991755.1 PBP1A family penicillin-binding protein [Patescibacteria group bacterium]MBU2081265.1 PBP1A family penicillin-binding protein [Patescibacteria group bacterium]
MPIHQLSRRLQSQQEWRSKRKKYYLRSNNNSFHQSRASNSQTNFGNYLFSILATPKNFKRLAIFIFALILIGFLFLLWLSRDLPNPNHLIDRQIAQSTKIYDRTGQTVLYEIYGDQKRTIVNLNDIPSYAKNATISIEDKDFYKHGGFSWWAMFRTAVTNLLFNHHAGGSTLTQQFIKNAVLTNEKTFTRKIKELILAYRLEKKFTKDEILQMYFNEIPYGSTAYGIESASQLYFGKSVKQINLAEATILAALPQAPSRYSPYGPNKDLLIARQHHILDLMVKYGYIKAEEAQTAKNTVLNFKEQSNNILAPHFVMYIKEILSDKYGEKMIEQDGLKIYTTLDLYKQKIAEEVIKAKATVNKNKYQASNAALISMDPKTGQVLAMVGSKDYFDNSIDGQVNITLQPRQPGSSFKPIVYTEAFIKGYTPDTVLYDVATNFSTDPVKPYIPLDYDGQERGPITMRKSLAGSLNIPAVKTLYLVGIKNVINLAQNMGYTTLSDINRFGLSLVLGGGEVKLIEHVAAYGIFAREGIYHAPVVILKIEDKNGKIIEENKTSEEKRVLDAKIARLTNNVLSDNNARAYVFGENNYLNLGARPVAAKTGTTNDYRDAWTIGFTPSLVTGVWVGNNDNSSMKRGSDGSIVAAPIWHDYMQKVLGNTPIEYFNQPEIIKTGKAILDGDIEGKVVVKIDKTSGLLATEFTPANFIEEKTFQQSHSILYYVDKNDPRGHQPTDPKIDPQFNLWETPVLAWAAKQGLATSSPPIENDNVHTLENKPTFVIENPSNNQSIMTSVLSVNINATAPRGISRVEYYLNDNLFATSTSYPFNLKKSISFLNNGFHNLTVKVCDDIDNCAEQKTTFNLILNEKKKIKNVNLDWLTPTDEVTLTKTDFPFTLKVLLNNYEQTAKANFYLKPLEGEVVNLTSFDQPDEDTLQFNWTSQPNPGVYWLSAETRGWDGQTTKSKEIKIIVR